MSLVRIVVDVVDAGIVVAVAAVVVVVAVQYEYPGLFVALEDIVPLFLTPDFLYSLYWPSSYSGKF